MLRITSIGECMIELSAAGDRLWRQDFAGDTYNTAVYLARLLAPEHAEVGYLTALGDDPISDEMLARWRDEGIDTQAVQRLPGRLPGLYVIRTDSRGERQFFYWRDRAAARSLMDDRTAIERALASSGLVYLSGITLAILSDDARSALLESLRDARQRQCQIAFDPNYRPRLWPDPQAARAVFAEAMSLATTAMPTFPDEQALFGDPTPEHTAARLAAWGVGEIVVKDGSDPCWVRCGDETTTVEAPPAARIVDTTGAGDSFNAGYIAARLRRHQPAAAAAIAHRLAGAVIAHPGAVIPRAAMPALLR